MPTVNELIEAWKAEERQPFTGWDFSYLDGRMFEDQAPWSYSTRAAELMRQSHAAIDMGTGGGERLLKLRPAWPSRMAATEEYPPNFRLSTDRLAPLGVEVKAVRLTRTDPLPYADAEFELVLNRHSAFNSREVARILTPGGKFLTQQVDGHWAEDLEAVFATRPQWPDATLENSLAWLKAAGLQILDARDWSGHFSFADVGAIVYYLRATPWLVPGFSVATHREGLLALQARLERGEPLAFKACKFLIEAIKT
jgi:SAM-dependent methyltransferase